MWVLTERTAIAGRHKMNGTARTQTYGYRISRDRQIFVFTAPTGYRGRPPLHKHQVHLGAVTAVAGGWRHEMSSDIYPTATDAAKAAIRCCFR
jgi:hypothetical protein